MIQYIGRQNLRTCLIGSLYKRIVCLSAEVKELLHIETFPDLFVRSQNKCHDSLVRFYDNIFDHAELDGSKAREPVKYHHASRQHRGCRDHLP